MADKIKRLEKGLKKKGLKCWLKPVANLEKSHFVIVESPNCLINSLIFKTEDFNKIIEKGGSFPVELIHYVALHNTRNEKAQIKKLLSNKFTNVKHFKF